MGTEIEPLKEQVQSEQDVMTVKAKEYQFAIIFW